MEKTFYKIANKSPKIQSNKNKINLPEKKIIVTNSKKTKIAIITTKKITLIKNNPIIK